MENEYYNKAISLINSRDSFKHRESFVRDYAWSIPTTPAINTIAKYCPLIEIGAGTGYWASLIEKTNGKIICFDKYNNGDNPYRHSKQYVPIYNGDHCVLDKFHPSMNLFLSWPPYNEPMAYDCLMAFKGKYLIYIGEGDYGCTGDNAFHNALHDHWKQIDFIIIPQWSGMHDYIYIYKRN